LWVPSFAAWLSSLKASTIGFLLENERVRGSRMSHADGVETAVQLAQIVTAFGIALGAIAAWVTYFFYHKKTLNENWGVVFRALYAEYWNSAVMAEMRKRIASEEEYAQLNVILRKRLLTTKNLMESHENDILEKTDKFCAVMIRILSFGDIKMDRQQRVLYDEVFTYWTDAILQRSALMDYIAIYWKALSVRLNKSPASKI